MNGVRFVGVVAAVIAAVLFTLAGPSVTCGEERRESLTPDRDWKQSELLAWALIFSWCYRSVLR